jgi:hypothetical protein
MKMDEPKPLRVKVPVTTSAGQVEALRNIPDIMAIRRNLPLRRIRHVRKSLLRVGKIGRSCHYRLVVAGDWMLISRRSRDS